MHILANHYDVRTKLAREILAELRKRHGEEMMNTFINFNTKLKESSSLGQPITEYDPACPGCRDFVKLAREVIVLESTPAPAVAPLVLNDTAPAPVPVATQLAEAAVQPPMAGAAPTAVSTPDEKTLLERADALAADADRLLATTQTLIGPDIKDPGKDQWATAHPTPNETERKIERIYGPRALQDGVLFVVRARGANRVQVAADFNEWNPDRTPMMHIDDETFQIKVPLAPGRYHYRYVIDGQWRNDPENHWVQANPFGELNNVVEVTRGLPVGV